MQVHVELAVREVVRDLVRPAHGQRGLADAGCPADRRDHCCPRYPVARQGQHLVERGQLIRAPDEMPRPGRQLPRHGRRHTAGRGRRRPWNRQGGVAGKHLLMQIL
jgi:hypothetical protein